MLASIYGLSWLGANVLPLLDLALLIYLCLLDRKLVQLEQQGLEIEKRNLEIYTRYFDLREQWLASRVRNLNKKTPETSGGLASSEISAPTQSADSGGNSGA